jgi:hypothetical protein
MQLNFALEFELGDAAQVLAQDFFLDLELVLVAGVLVMASAATSEMWAGRRDAVRRRFQNRLDLRTGEAGFFFGECGFDLFSGEDEGNEDGFAAGAVFITVTRRFGGKAGQAVAAVDELFDV